MARVTGQSALYRAALAGLGARRSPFIVGGTYAFAHYTGIRRPTKDLDLFVRREDRDRVLEDLQGLGFKTRVAFPHWLAKAEKDGRCIDVIHGAGNGIAIVDDAWLAHARSAPVLGVPVRLVPAEEMIWSKAFIMEKYRFDGADVAHLFLRQGPSLDWDRLVRRFGPHERVLLAHLVLFDFIYPGQRAVPEGLVVHLARRAFAAQPSEEEEALCRGVLLSRKQYRVDTENWGLRDARLSPEGSLSPDDVAHWNEADAAPPGPDAEADV